jgi:arylsulfatase A-like enzyme
MGWGTLLARARTRTRIPFVGLDDVKRQLSRYGRAFAWAIAAFGISSPSLAVSPARPNILLISLDTVRADFLTFRDSETAPHMTALARDGTIFTQAVSGTSWTLPAHVQMFTGTPPALHGVQSDDVLMDPRMPTLPELLAKEGYFTAGIFTNRYLSGFYGFDRGFDVYDSPFDAAESGDEVDAAALQGREALANAPREAVENDITSPRVVALARRALERADPADPVFVFAHFFDPHSDFIPPPPWDTKFDPDYEGDIDGNNYYWNKRITDETKNPMRQISDRDLDHIRALYRGEIGWTDESVGELLKLFEEYGRLDDAVIMITSDHGEEFFEHLRHGHRKSLHDEVLRVPLLIVPPRSMRSGVSRTIDQQASLSDILPTALDFARVAIPRTATGRSLRLAMYGVSLEERPELSSLYLWPATEGGILHWFLHSLRTPAYKFVRVTAVDEKGNVGIPMFAYFDLVEDPEELQAIADLSDSRVVSAWRDLESELDAVRSAWRVGPRSQEEERILPLELEWSEELVALGYALPGQVGTQSPLRHLASGLKPLPRIDPPEPEPAPARPRTAWRGLSLATGAILVLVVVAFLWRRAADRTKLRSGSAEPESSKRTR